MIEPGHQDRLQLSAVEYGGLFSENFLENRLPEWDEFAELQTAEPMARINDLWEGEGATLPQANEAQVEERFVQPILDLLGHAWIPQAGYSTATGRSIPDYALFLSDEARGEAAQLERNSLARFRSAVAIAEAKEFERSFHTRRGGRLNEDPHAQILRYLNETRVRWGILTNGRWWRLYSYERATQGDFYGVDLIALVQSGDENEFRRFLAFFDRSALEPDEQGRCFLDRAFEEAERSAIAVGGALERQVFDAVPRIASGLLGTEERTEEALSTAFENSLVFLYRMLFCLHAESRGLLPINNPHYEPQSLIYLRREVADQRDAGFGYSARSDRLYSFLRALFRIVDEGEPAFGVNAYNGGLFAPSEHSYFEGRTIPDPQMAPAIDLLSRIDGAFVDYRDLSVRHLGTIYESLLAYRLAENETGTLVLKPSPLKHRSGSYFTPSRVVDAIVSRTLEPLLMRRSQEVADAQLSGRAALDCFLDLKICDPAAGSAHFLVAATEYMAQFIATDPSYGEGGEGAFLELGEIRRLVAERCIHGVDINPMAVELARLSLWLATVDRDQPLTFLENLRVGNSIVGASVEELLAGEETVFSAALARDAEELLETRVAVLAQASATTDAVRDKERLAEAANELRRPLEEFADDALGVALEDPEMGDPFHWEVEFPEIFLTPTGTLRADGGFDAIVGNPPYIQIQSLGRATADFCREHYATAGGAFDAYIVFIERAMELLATAGRLGFIVPNKFTKLDMAKRLRGMLTTDQVVEELLDFAGAQLFGATNYTAILILDAAGGHEALSYRKLRTRPEDPIGGIEGSEPAKFEVHELAESPWILATPSERRILDSARNGGERLGEATAAIFTGLQTSADAIYLVEDLGISGELQRVRSKASNAVIEIEPTLLHPLASGTDVVRYAFARLRRLLLFPYAHDDAGDVSLIPWNAIEELPRTAAYLRRHEGQLRGREQGKMDHDGWYAYVYPKNLALNELPKLGVPRLCDRLRASGDPDGEVYLDNVDVNGVIARDEGPSVWQLLALLNSRLLDFLFKLHTVPFRGDYMSANKQFIAPLPVKLPGSPDATELEALGNRLFEASSAIERERAGFIDWLGDRIGADPRALPGKTKFAEYDRYPTGELLSQLRRSASQLRVDPGSRAFRDQLEKERSSSIEKLAELRDGLLRHQNDVDQLVYETYGIVETDRQLVQADYESGH